MKAIIVLIAFLLFLFFSSFSKSAFAVSVNIFSFPDIITGEPFTFIASISGAATGTNYLRADLYKDGTTNYFGETYNGSDWYNGSDGLQYSSVSVVKGSTASATIQARVGNPNANDFTGNGPYKFRVRRYTTSGSPGSGDTMSSVDITINLPPSPTPTNTPTPTSTPTPTPTKTPTSTPISTPTLTLVLPTAVLSESTESAIINDFSSITQEPNKETTNNKTKVLGEQTNNAPKILIGIGVIFLIACGILIFRKWKMSRGARSGFARKNEK